MVLQIRLYKKKKMITSIITIILLSYVGLGIALCLLQGRFTYQPAKDVPYNPGDIGLEFENVQLQTPDEIALSGWFIPADKAELTILFCHGNGGNISHRLDSIKIFNELGLSCLIFDYRGYGNSGGKTTEEGTYIDAQTAYNWLGNTKKIEPENIIIFGRSLGGAVAAHLASKNEKAGLIIESAFTSFADISQKYYPYMPVRLFVRYKYKTIEYIKDIDCPILVLHSKKDRLVSFKFGAKLYDAAKEPKKFIEIFGGHNDGFLYSGQIYTQGLKEWFNFVKDYQQGRNEKIGS
ncbi:MAG: alpha/beta hydrolase [Anaerohalosphaeraceae bacterium]|nr:alpha/beta hydrolase [Anaerohalosphaeraceae bacterium]